MHLIQILLPTHNHQGRPYAQDLFNEVRTDLANHFGGVTAYLRAPAVGLWEDGGELINEEIVIFEVMVDRLEREFWRLYRLELQHTFEQDVIVVRAQKIDML